VTTEHDADGSISAPVSGSRSGTKVTATLPSGSTPSRRPGPACRATLALSGLVLTLLFVTSVLAQAPAGGPAWNQLSPQQREALAPLAAQWTTIPAENKRKWLEIADRYPQLSPEGKARVQARMTDFSRLTPDQRRTARENFQRAYELPRESRESAVERYRSLPDDKKKELSTRSQRKDAAGAAAGK